MSDLENFDHMPLVVNRVKNAIITLPAARVFTGQLFAIGWTRLDCEPFDPLNHAAQILSGEVWDLLLGAPFDGETIEGGHVSDRAPLSKTHGPVPWRDVEALVRR